MTRLRFSTLLITGITLILLASGPAMAQLDRATLNGTITDPSGLPLSGAKVTATQRGTGLVREVIVPDSGTYVMPALPIGHYSVSVEAPGFETARYEQIELQVGTIRTLDVRMRLAGTAVEVQVMAEAPQLERSSAEIGSVIQENQIASLPVNGRHWAGLMLLAPGAVNTGDGSQGSTRFGGRANDDNNWTFDGVDNTAIKDPTYGTNARLVVSMDSIAEFKVSSSLYSAESGAGMGGQVHLVSKSGSNDFHGGAFEYLRNDIFDSRSVFDGPELPPFRLSQFGANLGGPIKKGKVFFFGNYEGLRQRQGSTYIRQVPSQLLRTEVLALSPELKPVIDAYPLGMRATKDKYVDDHIADYPIKSDENSVTLRLDYNVSDRTTLYGRWNFNDALSTEPVGMRPDWVEGVDQRTQNWVIQLQRTFSPTVVNETKLGVNRVPYKEQNTGPFAASYGIPGITSLPESGSQSEIGTTGSLIDNISVFRGRHNLKFGVELRHIWMNVGWTPARGADFDSVTSFINNEVEGIDIDGGLAMLGGRRTYYFAYAQDEFKLRPNFTLSFGTRYEYYSVLREKYDRMFVFDTGIGDFAPKGTPPYEPDRNNIAPRFSFAWSPGALKDRTVIRGGYGMYYGPGQVDDVMAPMESVEESFALDSADLPGLSFPIDPWLNQATSEGRTPRHLLPWRRDMYAQHWGLSIQQELPKQFVFQVSYNGGNAHKILSRTYINNINPATGKRTWTKFGKIDSKESAGNGNFNSMQLSLKRRLSGGLQVQSEYMWSHALNDGMTGGGESQAPQNVNDRRAGKANSNFDIRHTLTSNFLWELPFGQGRRFLNSGGVAGAILGGWDLSGIWATRTGRMLLITVTRSSSQLIDGNSSNQRPDLVSGVPVYPAEQTIAQWLNRAAFAVPAKGTWGNLGRNIATGPGVNQWDMALQKTMNLHEGHRLSFRAEFFNIFNRVHLGNPGTNIASSSFGRITSVMNREIGTGTPRQIQFMLRYAF